MREKKTVKSLKLAYLICDKLKVENDDLRTLLFTFELHRVTSGSPSIKSRAHNLVQQFLTKERC